MVCNASRSSKSQKDGPFHRIVWQGLIGKQIEALISKQRAPPESSRVVTVPDIVVLLRCFLGKVLSSP